MNQKKCLGFDLRQVRPLLQAQVASTQPLLHSLLGWVQLCLTSHLNWRYLNYFSGG